MCWGSVEPQRVVPEAKTSDCGLILGRHAGALHAPLAKVPSLPFPWPFSPIPGIFLHLSHKFHYFTYLNLTEDNVVQIGWILCKPSRVINDSPAETHQMFFLEKQSMEGAASMKGAGEVELRQVVQKLIQRKIQGDALLE
eukprot:s2305_g12.t1